VFYRVHGVFRLYRLLVEASVLPDGIVLAAGRWRLPVVYVALGVLTRLTYVNILDATWRASRSAASEV
jgi:hypothetical protein